MLLDSCVVIDVLRGREDARAFIKGLSDAPQVSVLTATELFAGIRDLNERRMVEAALAEFTAIDVGLEIATLAGDYIREFGPSHGVDPVDAVIAATAKTAKLELATLNLEHFPMFKGLKRPYKA
ncbi:MAG: type II toxin-antitoxin system VapC family toxin [Parvularculaceae bacterium]